MSQGATGCHRVPQGAPQMCDGVYHGVFSKYFSKYFSNTFFVVVTPVAFGSFPCYTLTPEVAQVLGCIGAYIRYRDRFYFSGLR